MILSPRIKGIILILSAAICWSFIGPFGSVAMHSNVTPLEVAFWRAFLAGSCFLVLAVISGKKPHYSKSDIPLLLGWVLLGVLFNFVAYMFAVHYVGNGLASILLYTAPLWIVILSVVIFKDFPRLTQLIALSLGLVGIVAICWPGEHLQISVIGIICGVASGLAYALQYFFNNSQLKHQPIFWNFAILFLCASLCMFPFVNFAPKTPAIWLSLFSLGAVATVLAYMFWSLSMRHLTPVTVAIIALLEPALATLWGVLFFNEQPSPMIYLGGMLILLSALLITIAPQKSA